MFDSKKRKLLIGLIAIIVVLFFVFKNTFFSDESRIKRLIFSAKDATEKEDLVKCLSFLAYDFSDNLGNDRSTIALMAKVIFDRYDKIKISIKPRIFSNTINNTSSNITYIYIMFFCEII